MTSESFFRHLYRNAEGVIGIFDARSKTTTYFNCTDFSGASEYAQAISDGGGDAYMNVCTRRSALEPNKRGSEADIPSVQVLWSDVDFGKIGHKSQTCPPTLEDAINLYAKLPRPSLVNNSGGGLHPYWLLTEPVSVAEGKARNKAIQAHIAREAEERGWHADAGCYSPAWMLRVPGTVNHKDGLFRPVTVISAPLTRYSADKFPSTQVTVKSSIVAEPRLATKSVAEAKIAMRKWLKGYKKPWCKQILDGEAFAEPGARDTVLNEVCATLAFKDPDTDAEALCELLRASLDAMEAESPCDKDPFENAVEKMSRHQARARQERADKEQVERDTQELLAKRVRQAVEPSIMQGMYTPEEIMNFAAGQNCSIEDFSRRWIIQRGETFYVFSSGEYKSAIQRGELEVSLPRDLAPAPIEWQEPTAKGFRKKKISEVLSQYGTVARQSIANMSVEQSYYDDKSETFVEAACRKRALQPRQDPQVHEWLTLLGGSQAELLLDWIATLTDLSRQTCAVYIVGQPGDGKTMFAEGLTRIWTTGAPCELESALSNFNESLVHCPIIFGDEGVSALVGDSAALRRLIGQTGRKLKRKHKPEADLIGAIRLILAANNDTVLNFEESMSEWDQEAVATRFLLIKPSPKCGAYLRKLGGREGTDTWVNGDRIACHALWLRDTRQVVRGNRFLVEANSKPLSRMLATQGKWPGLVCEWICKHIYRPSAAVKEHAIRVGDGKIHVNATELGNLWSIYITTQAAPTSALIGRTLAKLATGQTQISSQRYHVLDVETVLDWANRNQVGDIGAMRAAVEGASVEHQAKVLRLTPLDTTAKSE